MAWSGTQDYRSLRHLWPRSSSAWRWFWMVVLVVFQIIHGWCCCIGICDLYHLQHHITHVQSYIYICACVFNTSISTWLASRYCNCSTQSHTPDRMDKLYMKEFIENHWADRTKGTVPLGWARMTEHTQLAKVLLLHQAKILVTSQIMDRTNHLGQ